MWFQEKISETRDADEVGIRLCEVGRIVETIGQRQAAAEKMSAGGIDRKSIENAKSISGVWDGADEIEGNFLRYF